MKSILLVRIKNLFPVFLVVFFLVPSFKPLVVAKNDSFNPWIMEETLRCDFGPNGYFWVGYRGWCPIKWNATEPVPLEYDLSFHDEATIHPIHLRIAFQVDFSDILGNSVFSIEKVLLSTSDTAKSYNFDTFRHEISWNLSATETGIPNGDSWNGQIFMTATVTVGEMSYTNRTNSYNIFYYSIPPTTSTIPSWSIFFSLLPFVLCVFYRRKRVSKHSQ